jgi:hypothetical protein
VRAGGVVGSHAPPGARWRQPRWVQTAVAAQTGADASTTGSTEIAAFTGGAALRPWIGTIVTMGSRPLLGTSVLALGDLPSPRPITSSGPR